MQLTSLPAASVPVPTLIPGSKPQGTQASLGIQSTLQSLPLYQFVIAADVSLQAVMERFMQFPDLPGAIIAGIGCDRLLSRQQLLECLLYIGPIAPDTSIQRLLYQANPKALTLSASTSILTGAKQALKRPLEQQDDPILIKQPDGKLHLLDARTLNIAHWQIRGIETQFRYERLQMQLLQSEKMAALGRLVDGVAHEILDPVGFIWGNLSYIATYTQQQSNLLAAYKAAYPEPSSQIAQLAEDIELDYLRSDLPAAVQSAQVGAHRLKQLATSLQNFCHIDEVHPRPTDINALLDSTLRLLKSRITTPIAITRDYGKLPPIPSYSGQLSQVFMALFTNAIDSLLAQSQQPDYVPSNLPVLDEKPAITITTRVCTAEDSSNKQSNDTRWVSITISDNGPGLSPENREQILKSFSTESRSRKETGLALSYQIITAKHGGQFWIRAFHASENANQKNAPTGTEFEILLPLTVGTAK